MAASVCSQVDFLAISEIVLDNSFPTTQFNLLCFRNPYRNDYDWVKWGITGIYINRDIPSRMIFIPEFQTIPVHINPRKQKWLIVATYVSPSDFITELTKVLDKCRNNFKNMLF